ncbi:MAG: PKD domain-containing protein [Deltaproteobacteria bacterium]|nr:PKD domain-containing protein [Deltaproteobacteria bacterium]
MGKQEQGWAGERLTKAPSIGDDWGYASHHTPQKVAIVAHVKRLVWPTLVSPTMVRSGGAFPLLLRVRRGPDGRVIEPDAAELHLWRVYLISANTGAATLCRTESWWRRGKHLWLGVRVPPLVARDVYDVHVVAPGIDERQPNAARVFGTASMERFRFAVVTDHQLWDPSYRIQGRQRNAGLYPGAKAGTGSGSNLAIAEQGFKELALWDTEFVIHAGDLIFGLDFTREYEQARKLLKRSRLPIFAVPGNHDGYAIYTLKLRASLTRLLAAVPCRKHLSGSLSWRKAWGFIGCFYGDVKHHLFVDLQQDGLAFWRKQLGPAEYAFDFGQFRFIGLNTYAGTPERRHAFSVYMDVFDLHLGAPAVDNYGGYLTDTQLARVEKELAATRRRGLVPVIFAHHDPRGNAVGAPYLPNDAFPTDPLGRGPFEEWNFDSSRWDSNPRDMRDKETMKQNSAVQLLALLARYGGYYLSGHVHADERKSYPKGSMLGPHRVKRALAFIRTTSASSSVKKGAYWGYRLIEAQGRKLTGVDFSPKHNLGSVPAGNLWVRDKAENSKIVANGLPRVARVTIRFSLPERPEGYRFRAFPAADSVNPMAKVERPKVVQVGHHEGKINFRLSMELPAAPWPPSPGKVVRVALRAMPARDNTAPDAVVEVTTPQLDVLQRVEEGAGFDAAPGQPMLFSSQGSVDAQGDRIIDVHWDFGDGEEGRGARVTHSYTGAGQFTLRLTVIEETGLRRVVTRTLRIQPPRVPEGGCRGCCAPAGVSSVGGGVGFGLLFVLFGAGLAFALLRRHRG